MGPVWAPLTTALNRGLWKHLLLTLSPQLWCVTSTHNHSALLACVSFWLCPFSQQSSGYTPLLKYLQCLIVSWLDLINLLVKRDLVKQLRGWLTNLSLQSEKDRECTRNESCAYKNEQNPLMQYKYLQTTRRIDRKFRFKLKKYKHLLFKILGSFSRKEI